MTTSRTALVTGANRNLGRALVAGLAAGMTPADRVVLAGRHPARVTAAARDLAAPHAGGAAIEPRVLDVRDPRAVRALAADLGEVDIVFSNAAARMSPGDDPADLVDLVADTGNLATHTMLRELTPRLRPGGRLIVVASALGTLDKLGAAVRPHFAAAAGADLVAVERLVERWRRSVKTGRAVEDGFGAWLNIPSKVAQVAAVRSVAHRRRAADLRDGILLMALCPGPIDTDASRPWFADMSAAQSPRAAAAWPVDLGLAAHIDPACYGELVQLGRVVPWETGMPVPHRAVDRPTSGPAHRVEPADHPERSGEGPRSAGPRSLLRRSGPVDPSIRRRGSPPWPEEAPVRQFNADELMALVAERGLVFDPLVCEQVVAALDIGSHVILTGPPGTGKTSLAYLVAELGQRSVRCTGFQPVTATSDWSTDVTIGRYQTTDDGRIFEPGIFLEAISSGRWLVVDELNRSDFDRAFGQLFTVLAGQAVTLPFHQKGSELPLSLVPFGAEPPAGTDVLSIPHTWRMLATMNEVDKDLLHRLSYALMRRFAFIEVASPPAEALERLVLERPGGDLVAPLLAIRSVRDLGPAVFLDSARFAHRRAEDGRSTSRIRYEAFCSFVLPQLDGCDDAEAKQIFDVLADAFEAPELHAFRRVVAAITHTRHDPITVAAA